MADVKKKNSTKKKQKNNVNKVLIAFVIGILSVSLIVILSFTVFFKVSEIETTGSKIYSTEQIAAASGIKSGENLLLISEVDVNTRITKTLPFIASIKIEKKLPDKVNIVVTETKEYFTVFCNNQYYTSDAGGKILDEISEPLDELILMTVSDKTKIVIGETITFNTEREKELFGLYADFTKESSFKVNFVNISDPYETYIKLDDRLVAKMGSSSYFGEKINYLKASMAEISKDSKGIFDLSAWSPDNNKPIFSHVDISNYAF